MVWSDIPGAAPAFALAATLLAAGPVLNEVCVRPSGGEGEWIEIANPDPQTVSLEGWSLRDATGRVRRILAPASVPGGGFLLLAARPESLRARFALDAAVPVAAPESWPVLNDHDAGPGLPADVIVLADDGGAVRDSLAYFEAWLPPATGRSLERVAPGAASTAASSWGWSLDSKGATPGEPNSLTHAGEETGEGIWVGPRVVAPRARPGVFRFVLPEPGEIGVWLLDDGGREVAMLQAPLASPAVGDWVWGAGAAIPARPGLYFLCLRWQGASRALRRCAPVWVEP